MRTPKRQRRNRKRLLAATLLGLTTTLPLAADTPQDTLPGLGVQPVEYFYTGKPYDADSESYTFKYRNYDPELNRWTTADPSGFPDGANNYSYVSNTPTDAFDPNGLTTIYWQEKIFKWTGNYTVYTSKESTVNYSMSLTIPPGLNASYQSSETVIQTQKSIQLVAGYPQEDPLPTPISEWTNIETVLVSQIDNSMLVMQNYYDSNLNRYQTTYWFDVTATYKTKWAE